MSGYRHALACAELERHDDAVISAARRIAANGRSKVSVLTVVEPVSQLLSGLDTLREADFEAQMAVAARDALLKLCRRHDLPRESAHVIEGHPGKTIAEFASQHRIDLIAVGAHERHGLEHFLGTVASAVLHTADCDVLGVRLVNARPAYRRVAVALDPTQDTGAILDRARQFQTSAEIVFISVARSPFADSALEADEIESERLLDRFKQAAHSAAQQRLADAGFDAKLVMLQGTPSRQINRYTRKAETDLLIIGSGKATKRGWLIGSTTNNVLHDAPCDTLVVRPAEQATRRQP